MQIVIKIGEQLSYTELDLPVEPDVKLFIAPVES